MSDLLIRNLDPEIRRSLEKRAQLNGRSLSAEAQRLLHLALVHSESQRAEGSIGWASRAHQLIASIGMTSDEKERFDAQLVASRMIDQEMSDRQVLSFPDAE